MKIFCVLTQIILINTIIHDYGLCNSGLVIRNYQKQQKLDYASKIHNQPATLLFVLNFHYSYQIILGISYSEKIIGIMEQFSGY